MFAPVLTSHDEGSPVIGEAMLRPGVPPHIGQSWGATRARSCAASARAGSTAARARHTARFFAVRVRTAGVLFRSDVIGGEYTLVAQVEPTARDDRVRPAGPALVGDLEPATLD